MSPIAPHRSNGGWRVGLRGAGCCGSRVRLGDRSAACYVMSAQRGQEACAVGGWVRRALVALCWWRGRQGRLLPACRVRKNINKVAETWTREEKDHCLAETELSFKYSGALLREIAT